jgi:RNA polymerase sigma factor (sigma-70 family)
MHASVYTPVTDKPGKSDPAPALRALLPRVALGDELATRECVKRYGGLVWSLARRHAQSEAEDAVQDIFLELWRVAARFDASRGAEVTFVATIARRRLIDRRRALVSRNAAEERDLNESSTLTELPSEAGPDAQKARIALETLPEVQQRAVVLSVIENASHAEIAETLEIPLGTVKSYIRRGLDHVRAALSKAGDA